MAAPRKSSRREFLRGRTALEALEHLGAGLAPDTAADRGPASDETSPQTAPSPKVCHDSPSFLVELSRRAMACEFQISLNAGEHSQGPEAGVAALDLIDRLEDQLTVYRAHSEVSEINRRAAHQAVPVEFHLHGLLRAGVELSSATGGAFDMTAGPLVRLWSGCRKQGRLPTTEEIDQTRKLVDWRCLELDQEPPTIRFRRAGTEINLGAIGKGYALDRAAQLLLDAGVENFLFHGGRSSLIAHGARHGVGEGWRVAIRHPMRPDRPIGEILLLDRGMGTSGSGTQFFTHRGRRYGHILDPRTGWPVEGMLSTTVLAPTAAAADALSTAFYVMGVEAALNYCREHEDVSALLIAAGDRPGTVALHTANLDKTVWRPAE